MVNPAISVSMGFQLIFFREFEFAVEEMGGFGLGFKLLSYRTSFS